MGSVFVNGVEQERAGQTESLHNEYEKGGTIVTEPLHEVPACGHRECRVGEPCGFKQQREFGSVPGAGLAILCVGDGVSSNYYKVHHPARGRTVVYLFSGGHENDALELARREAESAKPTMGALSVFRPTPLSSRSGVDAILWRS